MGKETIRWNDRLLKNYYTCEVLLLVLAFPFWRVSFSCWQKTMYFGIRCKCTFYLLSGLLFFLWRNRNNQNIICYTKGSLCQDTFAEQTLISIFSIFNQPHCFQLLFSLTYFSSSFRASNYNQEQVFNLSQFPKFQQLLKIANLSR